MQKFLVAMLAFAAALEVRADTQSEKGPTSSNYKISGKKDEHRFGVELEENKQFHHTITAEDGVRLGCYGHELAGTKYSTHYVADGKGYRLVPHQSSITVYPKDGGEPRQASFVDTFKEEMIVSANIRYFFPEGCKGPRIEVDEVKIQPNPASPVTKTVVTAPPLQNTAGKTFGVSVTGLNGGPNGAGGIGGGAGGLDGSNRGGKQLFGNGKGGSGAGNLNGNNGFGNANGNNQGGFGNANGFGNGNGANNGRNTGSGTGSGPNGRGTAGSGSPNGRDRDLKQIFEDNLSQPIRPNVPALYDVPKTPGSVQTKSSVQTQSSVQASAQKSIPKNEDKKVVINRQPENVVASISAQSKTATIPAKPVAPISSGITVKPKTSASAITVKPKTASVTARPSVDPVRPSAQQAKSTASTSSVSKSPAVSNPSLISTPLVKSANDKCSDTCCDDNRPQILMSRASAGSCCKGVSKIVIPIDTDALSRIAMSEIIEITSETSSVKMLQKLLSLAEKYKL